MRKAPFSADEEGTLLVGESQQFINRKPRKYAGGRNQETNAILKLIYKKISK